MNVPKETSELFHASLAESINRLEPGLQCIVTPPNSQRISYAFTRNKPAKYTQLKLLLLDPESLVCQPVWLITRIS